VAAAERLGDRIVKAHVHVIVVAGLIDDHRDGARHVPELEHGVEPRTILGERAPSSKKPVQVAEKIAALLVDPAVGAIVHSARDSSFLVAREEIDRDGSAYQPPVVFHSLPKVTSRL
jgi:hypothetical protein